MQEKETITLSHSGKLTKNRYALLCALLGLAFAGAPSHANEADEVSRLIQNNQFEQAQARADAFLSSRPNDAQMRFLKGLILTERNKTSEALVIFTKLTEEFPELPEPYNNLAVLYAGRGEYEKARESLEMAIRTHPSYATAHENLGDVYAKLASHSYDKALQLDGRNSAAQTKLSLLRNLITGKPETITVAAATPVPSKKTAPEKTAPAEPKAEPKVEPKVEAKAEPKVEPKVEPKIEPRAEPKPIQMAKEEPKPIPPAVVARVEPKAPPPPPLPKEEPKVVRAPIVTAQPTLPIAAIKPTSPSTSNISTSRPADSRLNSIGMDSDVLAAIEAWAKAWTDQNIAAYLNSYSQTFDIPGKMNRVTWEKMREQRIVGKEAIRVVVENPLITIAGNEAVVKFKQSYFSNRLNNVSIKTLTMRLEGGNWKITSEKVVG